MSKEFKIYIAAFMCMFLLRAAAPIALNGGSPAPYSGGTVANAVTVPDGTISAPAVSFVDDTDLGFYYGTTTTDRMALNTTSVILAGGTTTSALTFTAGKFATSAGSPAIMSTDADTGIYDRGGSNPGPVFTSDGTAIAHITYSASSRAAICLSSPSNTSAPCLLPSDAASAVDFGFVRTNASTYTGTFDLSSGNIRGNSLNASYPNMTTASYNTTGMYGVNTIFYANALGTGTGYWAVSGSSDGYVQAATGTYIRIAQRAGDPSTVGITADCDADAERGRMYLDYSNNRLYICDGVTNGWKYYALSDT